MTGDGFWDDITKAGQVSSEYGSVKNLVDKVENISSCLEEFESFIKMSVLEDELFLLEEIERIESEVFELVDEVLYPSEEDNLPAIITINPGSGGTESCDWAKMLYRMIELYCKKNGWKIDLIDYQEGNIDGIKNVCFVVKGKYAFGKLKNEDGVHRMIRISPYDAKSRRHTSFASISVTPQIEETEDIIVNKADVKIDTFRSSGPGGQHANKIETAVRITHLPTGIIIKCQKERSQSKNIEFAMKLLLSELHLKQKRERENQMKEEYDNQLSNSWGSHIRSYVFDPNQYVKDHRNNHVSHNIEDVMNGNLDQFHHILGG